MAKGMSVVAGMTSSNWEIETAPSPGNVRAVSLAALQLALRQRMMRKESAVDAVGERKEGTSR